MLTRDQNDMAWVQPSAFRAETVHLLGSEASVDGQRIVHILKRLPLVDKKRRKRATEGMVYAIIPNEVRDTTRRNDVAKVE
jgi:hypothetical protein